MKTVTQLILIVISIVLAYFIYSGIQNKITFKKEAKERRVIVQNRLLKIADAQKEFKAQKGKYAANFNELFHFIENDSLIIIKAIGTVPDTLTEVEAVEQGIIIRDTTLIPAKSIFADGYNFYELENVPFSKGAKFKMDAGMIEKNRVRVSVFEAYTTLEEVYAGLSVEGEGVELEDRIQVGSMTEPITSGNW